MKGKRPQPQVAIGAGEAADTAERQQRDVLVTRRMRGIGEPRRKLAR